MNPNKKRKEEMPMGNCKVIALANQKGGVAKTTSTVNLGVGLANQGYKVLLIDADPQGSLTISLGVKNPDRLNASLATVMDAVIDDILRIILRICVYIYKMILFQR